MAKRKSFEAILERKFRWPTKGGARFVEAADPTENANVACGFARLVPMTEGYKKGGRSDDRCRRAGQS